MPVAKLPGYDCHYLFEDFGKNKTLMLGNSLGCDFRMWDDNIPYLSAHYNILRFDKRGHGGSTGYQDENGLTIGDLANDVLHLIEYLNKRELEYFPLTAQNLVFCGLSISGLTGQWLGLHHPERFAALILCSTAAKIGTKESWQQRIETVKANGLQSISQDTLKRWLTPDFIDQHPDEARQVVTTFENTDPNAYIACCKAIAATDFSSQAANIELPTLLISADLDKVTTHEDAVFLNTQIPNSTHKTLHALHLCNMELPQRFSELVTDFPVVL